ncbi:hypothetical protein LPAF129_20030 [Ligilactobacillus pabuli]|uniref:Acyltransferase 3 domain-containing protein n=1 Tax=Ligilactobacillus pabuli TaxID=2886039 RepID=A0ABQ5JJS7_9LACO|nr:acyltransferase family protein [Ligilactobacillus pabuli]GKS82317.1 hypothetical protein LPAF129_20030 [Ligilactobacillus pabuli]
MSSKMRDSRFELLRLVAILMVVLSHFSLYGQRFRLQMNPSFLTRIGTDLFMPYGKVGVSLFVLITGYFLGLKKIGMFFAFKQGWKIWTETIFYTLISFICFTIFEKGFNISLFVKSVVPVTTGLYWFVTMYVILIFLLPFINTTLGNLSKENFKLLIYVLLVINSMIPILSLNYEFMLSTPYLIGAYIRKYGINIKHKLLYLCVVLLLFHFLVMVLNIYDHGWAITNGILPIVVATLIFLFVVEMKPFESKFINKLATTSFAGYLVTEYPPVRNLLWKIIGFENVHNSFLADLYGLLAIIVFLYVGVFIVDVFRQEIFAILRVNRFPNCIYKVIVKGNSKM